MALVAVSPLAALPAQHGTYSCKRHRAGGVKVNVQIIPYHPEQKNHHSEKVASCFWAAENARDGLVSVLWREGVSDDG